MIGKRWEKWKNHKKTIEDDCFSWDFKPLRVVNDSDDSDYRGDYI